MRIAVISPVAWRTPPRHYGPWEQMASNVTEGLVARGHEVTLFATGDSITSARLKSVCIQGYEEAPNQDAKVMECLHISEVMEHAGEFDLIHNHFDFLPLTYSGLIKTKMITTIHGFSSPRIIPVYKKYDGHCTYTSISDSDRSSDLTYAATVYNGLDPGKFSFIPTHGEYLLFLGRIHPHKGPHEAIQIALASGKDLLIAGIIQDADYFKEKIEPFLNEQIKFIGHIGPEQRNQIVGGALAMLHPISFDEPFGLSVVESMLCGTPVIAFNRGSMPELIVHDKTGFLVHSVDEAVDAVSEVHKLNRQQSRDWAIARFSIDQMVNGYLEVYKTMLA